MTTAVRLRLSRARGFDLQAASLALNGLPAINCARPGRFGNLWRVGLVACGCRSAGECSHNLFRRETPAEAAAEHRYWLDHMRAERLARKLLELRGHNLACWCSLESPFCHVENYLELMAPLNPERIQ